MCLLKIADAARPKRSAAIIWMCSRTLNPNVDVVLRLFSLAGVFVRVGEGVCEKDMSARSSTEFTPPGRKSLRLSDERRQHRQTGTADSCESVSWTAVPVSGVHKAVVSRRARHALTLEGGQVATQLTMGLEVFDGHKLGLLS